ncbi:MAG: hypothetical protein BGP04_21540 [Rhizobiales bacterium 62-17]|nr:hypothetical protein [Hyphomicrobiales bacterium]OJY00188.1 MAG: hypothetical protein BGP04_21540 [Rhizobiales bacterium 62-17]
MPVRRYQFDLFADYFQLYLEDERADIDRLSFDWNDEVLHRLFAIGEGFVMIGTVRNMTVPLTIEVLDNEPATDFETWDHVAECHLAVTSGRLVASGCTDYLPDAPRIEIEPGDYRVRLSYGDLNTLSEDGLEGDDHYRVQMWRAPPAAPRVLKQRQIPL